MLGVPQPTPHPADTWHAAPDPVALFLLLGIGFIPAMYVCFALGLGELYDWWCARGWRPKHRRRPLK